MSGHEVKVDPSKVNAIIQWPDPTSLTGIRGFLGLTGYYRKFIRRYATIASLIVALLKKGETFLWPALAQQAFETLKRAITSAPILSLPGFSTPFDIYTDASALAIGAILSQHHKPIAFLSLKISPHLQTTSAYVRKMLAITTIVKK